MSITEQIARVRATISELQGQLATLVHLQARVDRHRICAWCPDFVSTPGQRTHGICPTCAAKLEAQARKATTDAASTRERPPADEEASDG